MNVCIFVYCGDWKIQKDHTPFYTWLGNAESELACAETMKIPESRQDKTEGSNEVGGQVLLAW
ncbi:uncharacterized protein PADG_11588 [Paracoccidioides brasiliensis Pb18]|uniref:Uncharacterized protein n=1 Tax=Paracoccidioides brasiliensis (strain Pb18) TaxID=502780 RepID=A0A0A0HUV1_PARBD|nr:uncharacterized protein PADG_11588 [Paracoccidioides brasiliensis Pb18]KGM92387.1 hypothetical protein PADG_11588 [Paracoccidioides brasiliensis Pb18]